MSAHDNASRAVGALRSLAEVQLQMQVARLATLDAQAIGVMAVDTATAAVVAGAGIPVIPRVAALLLLSWSAYLALRSNLLAGVERVGPSVVRLLASREFYGPDETFEELLLQKLAGDLQANERALAGKVPRLNGALISMALASVLALVGSLY